MLVVLALIAAYLLMYPETLKKSMASEPDDNTQPQTFAGLAPSQAAPPIAAAVDAVTGARRPAPLRMRTPHTETGGAVASIEMRPLKMPLVPSHASSSSTPVVTHRQRTSMAPLNATATPTIGNHGRLMGAISTGPKSIPGIDTVDSAQRAHQYAAAYNPAMISDLRRASSSRSAARHLGARVGHDAILHEYMEQAGLEKSAAQHVLDKGCSGFNTTLAMNLPSSHPCFDEMHMTVQHEHPSRIRA